MSATTPLRTVTRKLERHYGPPPKPFPTEPFQQILWENVAYLADDMRRLNAFRALKRAVGVTPREVRRATIEQLMRATSLGILAERFAHKLHEAARIALDEFDGDLDRVVALPLPQAKRALREFPGIGEPGAEKILLFSGRQALLAPDSNALRVMRRLNISPERKSYAATYSAARDVSSRQLGSDTAVMQRAHQLLRRHGQDVCTRSTPDCERCPLAITCPRTGVAA